MSRLSSPITVTPSSFAQQAPITKRQRSLQELLSSERAYASDLALIRDVHIPIMALGQQTSLNITSPSTSQISISSDSSFSSPGPPVTSEDIRIIFRNIAELAMFADMFCDGLEEALGSTLEGGRGEDRVGRLFLEVIPGMEKLFTYYITRHSVALAHLKALPKTPALSACMQCMENISSVLSHTRDLSSFLIKPVHRLPTYSTLLASIIDETPDMHSDKENLKLARAKMEEVVRNLNESVRRVELVNEVLSSKEVVNTGSSASASLTKMKSLWPKRDAKFAQLGTMDPNGEAARVERMQAELKRIDVFTEQFSDAVLHWVNMTSNLVLALNALAVNFGKVAGVSGEHESEAFDAFLAVIKKQLVPLCHQLVFDINQHLIKEIASLRASMNHPLKVLSFMTKQATSVKKGSPLSPFPLTNHVTVRAQLAAELPTYLTLLHRGLDIVVRRLAKIQATFWGTMHDRWAELWDMVRVEGEINTGHAETVSVWRTRWTEVDEAIGVLSTIQTKSVYQERPLPWIAPTKSKAFTSHETKLTAQPPQRAPEEQQQPQDFNSPSLPQQPTYMNLNKDSWKARRTKYVCQVVHAWKQPVAVSYFNFPFFTLVVGEHFDILHEAGHPSTHPDLPLPVDDGENCLLLCRDGAGEVGWALASFLAPA